MPVGGNLAHKAGEYLVLTLYCAYRVLGLNRTGARNSLLRYMPKKIPIMDKNEQTNMSSARTLRTPDEKNSAPATIDNPISYFLSGGEMSAGSQLYFSGKLREEYEQRSKAIPETLSKEQQRAMRTNLKNEIRGRQNPLAKAIIKQIDAKRAADDAESAKRGEPSKYKKNHAQSTNKAVNALGKASKLAGRSIAAIGIANEAYNVYKAPKGGRIKEASRAAGRLGGGILGGSAGAAVGSLGCNPGTVLAGAAIGGTAGSMAGEKAVDVMWDLFGK